MSTSYVIEIYDSKGNKWKTMNKSTNREWTDELEEEIKEKFKKFYPESGIEVYLNDED